MEKHADPEAIDALARRLFKVLMLRGIGFGWNTYDELPDSKQEVYRNDARIVLLMEHLDVTA